MDSAPVIPRAALETYRLLLRKYQERGYRPQESLTDALALSTRQGRLTQICRQAGDPSAADAYAGERLALWRHWNQRLPDNSLIIRELADAQNKLLGAH